MDNLEQNLERALAGLGGTAEEVAARVRAEGVRGARWKSNECALARYLDKALPGCKAYVGTSYLSVCTSKGEVTSANLTGGAYLFRQAFDEGHYPELTEP
jgi:hypothetical protein